MLHNNNNTQGTNGQAAMETAPQADAMIMNRYAFDGDRIYDRLEARHITNKEYINRRENYLKQITALAKTQQQTSAPEFSYKNAALGALVGISVAMTIKWIMN